MFSEREMAALQSEADEQSAREEEAAKSKYLVSSSSQLARDKHGCDSGGKRLIEELN